MKKWIGSVTQVLFVKGKWKHLRSDCELDRRCATKVERIQISSAKVGMGVDSTRGDTLELGNLVVHQSQICIIACMEGREWVVFNKKK